MRVPHAGVPPRDKFSTKNRGGSIVGRPSSWQVRRDRTANDRLGSRLERKLLPRTGWQISRQCGFASPVQTAFVWREV